MKKVCLPFVFLICLNTAVRAQTPDLLVHGAQCLSAKHFLPLSKVETLHLGYLIDEKSYPGDRVLYLVDYNGPDRSKGYVFAIFLTQQGQQQVFDIQNNATFKITPLADVKTSGNEIDFPGPPLGGTWTQQHLMAAIRQINQQPSFAVAASDFSVQSPHIDCAAYTDKQ
jgi:hypothetical protein